MNCGRLDERRGEAVFGEVQGTDGRSDVGEEAAVGERAVEGGRGESADVVALAEGGGDAGARERNEEERDKVKSAKDCSPQEKLEAVLKTAAISEEQPGVWLRRKGLKEEHRQQGASTEPARSASISRNSAWIPRS